jgi:hypothetical protein
MSEKSEETRHERAAKSDEPETEYRLEDLERDYGALSSGTGMRVTPEVWGGAIALLTHQRKGKRPKSLTLAEAKAAVKAFLEYVPDEGQAAG